MPETRQLAAIMFTDIVGYTTLMGDDEEKAFEVLEQNRQLHKPLINKHNGRLLKEMGDGILASFSTVSDAVYCAGAIVKACENYSAIDLRIGIHLGEVVFKDDDVFGDGVNIASRLESIAPIGSILVSESVYLNLVNKKGIKTTYVREERLKNVKNPVKIYQVEVEKVETLEIKSTDSSKLSDPSIQKPANWRKPVLIALLGVVIVALAYLFYSYPFKGKPDVELADSQVMDKSIAVLPLDYLSEDQNKQYLADGVMDAITGNLSKIKGLRVTPRTSVEQYRGTTKTASIIGEELNVSYLIEGSFLMVDNQVKLIIQLVVAKDEDHIFFNEYDRDYKNIMAVQSEVAQTIAKAIEVEISPKVEKRIEAIPTENLEAYDFYLKGMDYLSRSLQEDDFRFAIQMFERAVEIDPNFTLAWVGLAGASNNIYCFNYESEDYIVQIKQYLDRAIALDPDLMEVQLETGMYYYHCKLNYPKALQILEKLNSEYPNNDQLYESIGWVYRRMGQFDKFLEYIDQAISLNPTNWVLWYGTGETLIMLKRYKEAEDNLKTAIDLNPSAANNYIMLAQLYLIIGELDKARTLMVDNQNIDNPFMYKIRSNIELMDRNYKKAIKILESSPYEVMSTHTEYTTKSLQLGLIYYVKSDREQANTHFNKARQELEDKLSLLQNDSRIYSSLGLVYAGLGLKEEAVKANDKAMSIMNISVDAFRGVFRELDMAQILVMIGEYDEAITKLEFLLMQNSYISVELLKKDPFWDPLMDIEAFKTLIDNPKYQINLEDN